MNNFAETLKKLRKENNLTQTDLAERLFTSAQTVSRWENGDGEPSLDQLASLAEIFGVSIDRLISGKPIPEKELFDGVTRYVAEMPEETAADAMFTLCYQIMNGFDRRYFPDYPHQTRRPTYSTLHAGTLSGRYADRDDTPTIFVMRDGRNRRREADAIEQANLTEIFAALSDDVVLRALANLKRGKMPHGADVYHKRLYDAESVCRELELEDADFPKTAAALITLGALHESTISYNGTPVQIFENQYNGDIDLLLSLTYLLYRCGTDGNM